MVRGRGLRAHHAHDGSGSTSARRGAGAPTRSRRSLIAQHGRLAFALSDASWVTIIQGWIFAAIGATDATSRIVVTLCGLLLIAIGFALRRCWDARERWPSPH